MEHSFFINEKTMKRMAKEGAFAAPQTWGLSPELANNPLEDISVTGGRDTWFAQPDPATHPIETPRGSMKEGTIYKDTSG